MWCSWCFYPLLLSLYGVTNLNEACNQSINQSIIVRVSLLDLSYWTTWTLNELFIFILYVIKMHVYTLGWKVFRRGSFDVKTAGKRQCEDKSHLLVFLRAVGQQDAFLHVAVENPLDGRHVAFYDVFHLTSTKQEGLSAQWRLSGSTAQRENSEHKVNEWKEPKQIFWQLRKEVSSQDVLFSPNCTFLTWWPHHCW